MRYDKTPHTLRKYFDELDFEVQIPAAPDYPIPIVFDATFFGRTYGIFLFRSNGANLYWRVIETETGDDVQASLNLLERHDYKFASFTVDGRKSALKLLREKYPSTPVQLCHFHFIKTVIKYLTTRPKTDLGKELYKLARKVGEMDNLEFKKEFDLIKHEYKNRLSKKIKSEENYENERKVINNINNNLQYLFAYKKHPELNIPNTTNSCEGAFSHLKQKIKIHRGLRKDRREKMIFFLLTKNGK